MKVSCNYRQWVKGRPIFDHWHQTHFVPTAGENENQLRPHLSLRRTYVPISRTTYQHHAYEEDEPFTFSSLVKNV
jgi:hypothetical protein